MQLLIGHGQVPTIMPEASFFKRFIQGSDICEAGLHDRNFAD